MTHWYLGVAGRGTRDQQVYPKRGLTSKASGTNTGYGNFEKPRIIVLFWGEGAGGASDRKETRCSATFPPPPFLQTTKAGAIAPIRCKSVERKMLS